MAKYVIWDKKTDVITPSGKVFTPEEWIAEWPFAGIPSIDVVISGGTINGALINEYSSFIQMYEDQGCDFSDCASQQECLDKIEAFEKEQEEAARNGVTTNERIAAALEAQVMLSLDDQEV